MKISIPTPSCIDTDKDIICVDVSGIFCGSTEKFTLEKVMYSGQDIALPTLMTFHEILDCRERAKRASITALHKDQ